MQYASQYPGQEKKIFEFIKSNPSRIENIRAPIFENKVLESVLEKSKRIKKSITIKDFEKLQEKTFSFSER